MAEDLKEKIYEFLKEKKPKKYNIKQISNHLKISYPTVLKWIEVLLAEQRKPKLNQEDYGNLKLVWIE